MRRGMDQNARAKGEKEGEEKSLRNTSPRENSASAEACRSEGVESPYLSTRRVIKAPKAFLGILQFVRALDSLPQTGADS